MSSDEKSSLKYWDERWGKAPGDLSSSWPDNHAIWLERTVLDKYLPEGDWEDKPIVEIGCGNLHVLRSGILSNSRRTVRTYIGIEGSTAVRRVNNKVLQRESRGESLARVFYRDLTGPRALAGIPDGSFLLSKRTLQNIHPDHRAPLIERLRKKFEHGLVIEDMKEFRNNLNIMRSPRLAPLDIPAFNWPLHRSELPIRQGAEYQFVPFMNIYYSITRVWPDCPRDIRERAYQIQEQAIWAEQCNAQIGPVVMFTW